MNSLIRTIRKIPLINQIAVGLVIGILLAVFLPGAVPVVSIFGDLFVKALKGVAPLLVFILVMNAMVQRKEGGDTQMKPIITLYVIGTFVTLSFLFPQTLMLQLGNAKVNPPSGIAEVVHNLVLNIVDNPLNAILTANYIGILAWAVIIGLALHKAASPETKHVLEDLSAGITKVVTWVIHFAPLGIMGLVTQSISASGLSALISYFSLLGVLLGSYFLVALVMNPAIVYLNVHKNPYPLVWATLKESGIYAFFTRSSAANIPVNMALCEKLNLDRDTYSVSIPLGATINMAGAAITITVLTLAAVHTLNIPVDLPTALLLSVVASLCACGASGVAGGSMLLIPLACNMFGIPNDVAMQVVAVGFIIGVLQDSCETALNSSTDALFTAAACMAEDDQLAKNALRG